MDLYQNSSVFDNPTQATHTLLDWHNMKHKDGNVKPIEQIRSLNEDSEMINNMKEFCEPLGLTLMLGKNHLTNCSAV